MYVVFPDPPSWYIRASCWPMGGGSGDKTMHKQVSGYKEILLDIPFIMHSFTLSFSHVIFTLSEHDHVT